MKSNNPFITHCKQCGKSYEAQRSSRKFCSDACRLKHNRAHKSGVHIDVEIQKIRASLYLLENLSDDELASYSFEFESLFSQLDKMRERRKDIFDNIFGLKSPTQ